MTIILHHFLRGEVEVVPSIVEGRREWTCPNRPMMRPWDDCLFLEKPEEIDALLEKVSECQRGHGGSAPGHGS